MKRMVLGVLLLAGLLFLGCDDGRRRGDGPRERGGSYDRDDHRGDRDRGYDSRNDRRGDRDGGDRDRH